MFWKGQHKKIAADYKNNKIRKKKKLEPIEIILQSTIFIAAKNREISCRFRTFSCYEKSRFVRFYTLKKSCNF